MKLILSTHNLKVTEGITEHILSKIEKLDHFEKRAIDARVTVDHDNTRTPEKAFGCSIRLAVPGNDLFAEDHESDLYAAIDRVTKKIEQQIRKRHNKTKAKKHSVASKLKEKRKAAVVE